MFKKLSNVIIIQLASLLAVIGAYGGEFFLNLEPCIFCIYQRIPFIAAFLITFFLIFFPKNKKINKSGLIILSALFFAGFILAGINVAIEQGYIHESGFCSISSNASFSSVEKLREFMVTTKIAHSCRDVTFRIAGLSLASLNLIYSGTLCVFAYSSANKINTAK